jgi:hypothetical protein
MIDFMKLSASNIIVSGTTGAAVVQFNDVKAVHDGLIGSPTDKRQAARAYVLAQLRSALGVAEVEAFYRDCDVDPATGRVILFGKLGG